MYAFLARESFEQHNAPFEHHFNLAVIPAYCVFAILRYVRKETVSVRLTDVILFFETKRIC